MARIAPVTLYSNPKAYWFDAGDKEISVGQGVVVSTARGVEFGRLSAEVFEATTDQVSRLKTPLKPIIRVATDADLKQAERMELLSAEALPVFKEMAAEMEEEMRPVSVEYLLDGDKAVFYFEADERVDFRDLVRKLASHFHIRVDMRQIGVRDEARLVGGLGHCGQELCCKRLGGEFCPVSIRMAKEQDLSLNPQKISGVCGRLMCCLRYEYEAYKDFKKRAPKQGAMVSTPEGDGKVVDLDVPREIVSIKVGDEKPVKVPLSDFDEPEEGCRPNCVGCKAWDCATAPDEMEMMSSLSFMTDQLTGKDTLGDRSAVRRTGSAASGRKKRASRSERQAEKNEGAVSTGRKQRRRRSTKVDASGAATTTETPQDASKKRASKPNASTDRSRKGMQPKRANAAKRAEAAKAGERGAKQGKDQAKNADQKQSKPSRSRRSRNRSSAANAGARERQQQQQRSDSSVDRSAQPAKSGPRPGHRSSGLRRGQDQPGGGAPRDARNAAAAQDGAAKPGSSRRRPRRRSRKGSSETPSSPGNQE